ncbi:translin [Tribolium castaneum]|uniref:Translin n=1 Tax=Tribolium castaneum TaxID=7070 RepID=D6WQ79_TRICA|nr:PREDICTED: translin isoform X1 [Tribolium castaneum]EFA07522.2 translin [Tribolium castaneum]|eukprot:XP_008195758.1 PREDICTED: translin isoform X1 [Tribolium castaneum]
MSSDNILENIFTPFQECINNEQDVREEIRNIMKDIEKPLREIVTTLQIIHRTHNGEEISAACFAARELFESVRAGYEKLDGVVPAGQYYRYNDHWRFATQRLCFLAALIIFLEKGFLVDKETTAQILGLHEKSRLHLDLEDYLMGLLNLATELSRFAVNSVTYGDYNRPLQISKFVAELNAGFRLLNLKNDSLRKRFDALKYDVKKIEEVVYDLSLRGLVPNRGEVVE